MNDGDERRTRLHEFLQAEGAGDIERPAVLIGWCIVLEWMDDSGDRWLSKAHAPGVSHWHASGMHHEALYGDWPEPDNE